MAESSYNSIGTFTLSSAQSQITFSNIPQIYTDLVLVASTRGTTTNVFRCQFNGDTGANYSDTQLLGTGASAISSRDSNVTFMYLGGTGMATAASTFDANVVNIMNYSSNTAYKTVLNRSAEASTGTTATAGVWRNTAAINSITLIKGVGNYQTDSTFSLYGVGANQLKATGGNIITTDGLYWYHAFKTPGTFTPLSTLSCDVLVIGGGGGGGAQIGGGGGAGGVFYATSQSISTAQTVTIGAGGIGGSVSSTQGSNGSNSTFGSLTAALGGGGGGSLLAAPGNNGINGGSGGGSGTNPTAGTAGTSTQTGTGGTGYGFAGGVGNHPAAGGGGGAGAVGSGAGGGQGGNGLNTWSQWLNTTGTGVSGYIAGGGSGASNTATYSQAGGLGGGGAGGGGTTVAPGWGLPNTGGGGGGARDVPDSGEAGARGGSGLVIVRYAV